MLIHQAQHTTKHLANRLLDHYRGQLHQDQLSRAVDLDASLAQLGATQSNAEGASDISLQQYFQLLSLTAPMLQQHGFFLRLGQRFEISDAGVLGYASLSVNNLRESWALTSRHYALYPHPLTAQRLIKGNTVALRLNVANEATTSSACLQEDWLSSTWKWMCQRLPTISNSKALTIKLAYPKPRYSGHYHEVFPGRVLFDQDHTEFCFPESWYELPFPNANPATAALCQQQCQLIMGQLQGQTDLVEQVQRTLLLSPQREFPSLEAMAAQFQMPPHSFHRQLKKSGRSYRDIVTQLKMELAKDYLSNTNLPLQEVSYLLGYRHAENFYRAFKQWLGITASEFRHKQI